MLLIFALYLLQMAQPVMACQPEDGGKTGAKNIFVQGNNAWARLELYTPAAKPPQKPG